MRTGKTIIVQSKLFKIIQQMPKGGLLHSHLDATVNTRLLLKLGLAQPAMHIRVPEKLTASNLQTVPLEFLALPEHLRSKDKLGLTHEDYVPSTWIQLQVARETFDPKFGGPAGFDDWVENSLTINPAEAYGSHNTVTKVQISLSALVCYADGIDRYGKSSNLLLSLRL